MQILSAEFVKSAVTPADYPADGLPQIAVAGRSNVGKSSLLNMLAQRKGLVKTSQVPGKTRLINFFLINKSGPPGSAFYLVDIPGFGYAKVGRAEKRLMEEAIEIYFRSSKTLRGLLYLIDSRIADSAVDREAMEWLQEFDIPILAVATKGDKLSRSEAAKALADIAKRHGLPEPPLLTSAEKKVGREEVLEQIGMLIAGEAGAGERRGKG
jgi:GTP-binding protein